MLEQGFDIETKYELPTMLQVVASALRALTKAELRWLRHHNQVALSQLSASSPPNCKFKPHLAASHWNLHTLQLLVSLTNHVDSQLVRDLSQGFPITGDIPDGGLFPKLTKPRVARCDRNDLMLRTRDIQRMSSYLRTSKTDERLQEALSADILAEVSLGRAEGRPFKGLFLFVTMSFQSQSRMFHHCLASIKATKFVLYRTIPSVGAVIRSNNATTTRHKVEMPRLGHVASFIAEAKSDQTDFHLARIDHQAAYRQLPLTKQDASYAAGLFIHTDGSVQVVKPLVAPFGAIGSVSAYLRVGELHCHLARCLGLCPLFSYMDDYFSIEGWETCQSSFEFFLFLNTLTGAQVKSSKTVPPASRNVLLGLELDLSSGGCVVRLTPTRRVKLLSELHAAPCPLDVQAYRQDLVLL